MRLMTNDEKVMEGYFASLMDDGSDSDEEYLPNEDWKAVGVVCIGGRKGRIGMDGG